VRRNFISNTYCNLLQADALPILCEAHAVVEFCWCVTSISDGLALLPGGDCDDLRKAIDGKVLEVLNAFNRADFDDYVDPTT
jgi:hypothetical protein